MSGSVVSDAGSTIDLVAFEVEGSGYFLVPLVLLGRYEVAASSTSETFDLPGWGWSLPIVRWNTFHSVQIGLAIALAPGVIAHLDDHHFISTPTPAPRSESSTP